MIICFFRCILLFHPTFPLTKRELIRTSWFLFQSYWTWFSSTVLLQKLISVPTRSLWHVIQIDKYLYFWFGYLFCYLLLSNWAETSTPSESNVGGDALEWEDLCIVPWLKLYDSESGSGTIQVTWQQAYLSRHCIQSEVGCMEMEPVGTSCMSHRASIASSCGIGCWN